MYVTQQFAPGSSLEVLITSADSRIRVVNGDELVHKFKGNISFSCCKLSAVRLLIKLHFIFAQIWSTLLAIIFPYCVSRVVLEIIKFPSSKHSRYVLAEHILVELIRKGGCPCTCSSPSNS
jgi:hypothetical protein